MKAFVPSDLLVEMELISKGFEYGEDSIKRPKQTQVLKFEGAEFPLNYTDLRLLEGISLNDVVKKIYCYVDLKITNVIKFSDQTYKVISIRDYGGKDDLRIYYVQRVNKNG